MAEHLVIVGASRAGLFAAEGARRAGYQGQITLIGAEPHLPYDRPPLSKEFLAAAQDEPQTPVYRSSEALQATLGVDLRLGVPATALDTSSRIVWVGDDPVGYTALVIATGTTARRLPATSHLDGVFTLRTVDDARRVRAAFDTQPATVVVGAGLIGSEIGSAGQKRGLAVTIVEPMPVPLSRVVGEQSGKVCAQLHERHGTTLLTGVTVTGVSGRAQAEQVVLSDGTTLDAELVVVGIGVEPDTGWLGDSGLQLDNGLVCDATLNAGVPGVYGAGDVVRWFDSRSERSVRLENWTSAAEQGRIAGHNAVLPDDATPYVTVPYVWSDQYGSRLQFVGDADADEIVTVHEYVAWGSAPSDGADDGYLALYRRAGLLAGAFGINRPRLMPKLRALIARGGAFDDAIGLCGS